VDDLFERLFRDPWGTSLAESAFGGFGAGPPLDVSETDKQLTLRFELPGVKPDDVEINVSGSVLTLRGEKSESREEKSATCTYSERSYGSFSRSVQLPSTVDPDKVEATYKDGVLSVTLGKHPGAQPKRITVKSG
jgi:HSP20 family protein